jgi:uncharacterized protein YjbJ (UPF0337 family)
MRRDQLEREWSQLRGEAKSIWGKLTDADLNEIDGDSERLIRCVQIRYGFRRDAAEEEVESFLRRYRFVEAG